MERFFEVLSRDGRFHAAGSLGAERFPLELLEFQSPIKALVLATCPHEELMGCGGTMRKLMEQGSHIKVVYMASGWSLGQMGGEPSISERQETAEALQVLGCEDFIFMDQNVGEDRQVLQLLDLMCHLAPKEMFIPSFHEMSPGAQCTALIGMRAMEMYPGRITVNCYEVLSPITPTALVNITDTIGYKYESIVKHVSNEGIGEKAEKIIGLNAYRSLIATKGSRFCEAFIRGNGDMMALEARKVGLIP